MYHSPTHIFFPSPLLGAEEQSDFFILFMSLFENHHKKRKCVKLKLTMKISNVHGHKTWYSKQESNNLSSFFFFSLFYLNIYCISDVSHLDSLIPFFLPPFCKTLLRKKYNMQNTSV